MGVGKRVQGSTCRQPITAWFTTHDVLWCWKCGREMGESVVEMKGRGERKYYLDALASKNIRKFWRSPRASRGESGVGHAAG